LTNQLFANSYSDNRTFFDGQSIDGWCMALPGKFVLQSDRSLQSQGELGLLWYTKKKYKDFILKVDWKVTRRNDNFGAFVRFSDPDSDAMIAVNTGYEIQIDDLAMPDANPLHKQVQYTTLQLLQIQNQHQNQ
jgi:3-keto-disaccharide hydrolase